MKKPAAILLLSAEILNPTQAAELWQVFIGFSFNRF